MRWCKSWVGLWRERAGSSSAQYSSVSGDYFSPPSIHLSSPSSLLMSRLESLVVLPPTQEQMDTSLAVMLTNSLASAGVSITHHMIWSSKLYREKYYYIRKAQPSLLADNI